MLSTIQELGNIVVNKIKSPYFQVLAFSPREREKINTVQRVTRAVAVIKQVDERESTRDGCFCGVRGRTLAKLSPHPGFEGCFARL